MKQKSLKTEGIFSLADRFVSGFFDALKRGAENQVIQQAKNAKLPPSAIKNLERMQKEHDEFVEAMNKAIAEKEREKSKK